MIKIKNRIERELPRFILEVDKRYSLSKISPLLIGRIREFASRNGKRVRPTLFVTSYLGFAKKEATGLYTSALSIEFLHDFMLVHDDIIDKSDTRRGKPSMHKIFNDYLKRAKNIKFNGEDLAIVAGDVMYAIGLNAFLAIDENKERKERAMRSLIEAALYTGCGEFVELLYGIKPLKDISKKDIYKIYDYKTACYTFASPLAIGAILGGAGPAEIKKLYQYGIYLGRAFQIKDDILGMFGSEKKIGKSTLTDLQEAKKTILIWYAYKYSGNKTGINRIFTKPVADKGDLKKMQDIIIGSRALEFAKKEVSACLEKAKKLLDSSKIKAEYKKTLKDYAQQILEI